jgi:hypothetical protein
MDENYTPKLPTKVRDASYIGGLATAVATPLAVVVVSVVAPNLAGAASTIGMAILAAAGTWTAGVGVAYRPGKIGGTA